MLSDNLYFTKSVKIYSINNIIWKIMWTFINAWMRCKAHFSHIRYRFGCQRGGDTLYPLKSVSSKTCFVARYHCKHGGASHSHLALSGPVGGSRAAPAVAQLAFRSANVSANPSAKLHDEAKQRKKPTLADKSYSCWMLWRFELPASRKKSFTTVWESSFFTFVHRLTATVSAEGADKLLTANWENNTE